MELKGITGPVPLYHLTGETAASSSAKMAETVAAG
jgi:hypothetical protein